MDPSQFVDSVREENETALSEVLADTDGMDTQQALRAAADGAFHARETFGEWADSAGNGTASETYAATASEEGEYYGRITRLLDGEHQPDDTPAIHEYLRDTEDTAGRAGAFVGWAIVTEASNDQLVDLFADHAETSGADLFRDLDDEADAQLERGQDLLGDVCATDDEWSRAQETAGDVIQNATSLL